MKYRSASLTKSLQEDSVADGAIGQNEELVDSLTDFITHNEELQKQASPIQKTLMKRMLKQTYDPDMAIKYWVNLVDLGVKTYQQDFGKETPDLTKSIRVQVASKLAKDFEDKVNSGAIRVRDVLGVEALQELAGAGVGVGVLNQTKPEESGEEESSSGDEEKSGEESGEEEKPEATTKESLFRGKSMKTIKVTQSQLREMVEAKVKEALTEAAFRESPYAIFKAAQEVRLTEMGMDLDSYIAMRLAQAGYTPADAPKLVAQVRQTALNVAKSEAERFEMLLKSSLKKPQWQQFSKKNLKGR